MLVLLVRTLILYAVVVLSMRLMGKRQIGELQPSELVVAIMISEVASIPMEDLGIPILSGIIPIITLVFAEIILSYITLKSRRARQIVFGRPSIIMQNGQIKDEEMKRLRLNIDDLLEELRKSSVTDINDVEYAILETNGQLSVVLKSSQRPVTIKDLNLKVDASYISYVLVEDGEIDYEELNRSKKSEVWLTKQLRKQKITNISDVLIASLDTKDGLYVQLKSKKKGGK